MDEPDSPTKVHAEEVNPSSQEEINHAENA